LEDVTVGLVDLREPDKVCRTGIVLGWACKAQMFVALVVCPEFFSIFEGYARRVCRRVILVHFVAMWKPSEIGVSPLVTFTVGVEDWSNKAGVSLK
jgi:hypothetical protein